LSISLIHSCNMHDQFAMLQSTARALISQHASALLNMCASIMCQCTGSTTAGNKTGRLHVCSHNLGCNTLEQANCKASTPTKPFKPVQATTQLSLWCCVQVIGVASTQAGPLLVLLHELLMELLRTKGKAVTQQGLAMPLIRHDDTQAPAIPGVCVQRPCTCSLLCSCGSG
jgi:hypothetical protein